MICYCLLLGFVILSSFPGEFQSASLYGFEYNPEDFVVAQPTCVHRLPLTRVNRLWRGKGIRSFTVINNTELVRDLNSDPSSKEHLEAFGYWEDDSLGAGSWRGGNVGDTRAAVTPVLAHSHFGDTYKWMLYGDDDTLFYMTGVLKLLTQFDPEQPLAITDNIWFYAQHTNPGAPRCLPCGFNTSTIVANHTFIPRPACPFCARALACGTYGPRYRCNASHLTALETEFGPALLSSGSSDAGGGSSAAATMSSQSLDALRSTAARYAAWMDHHVDLKSKYPYDDRDKPTMDWEMRDPWDWHTADTVAQVDETSGDSHAAAGARRRRRRRTWRRALQDSGSYADERFVDDGQFWGDGLDRLLLQEDEGAEVPDGARRGEERRRQRRRGRGLWRRLLESRRPQHASRWRKKPVAQGYVDGTAWLSAALGRPLGGPDDPERQALQLPYPFCARHDDRLHGAPTPSCLLSVAGHGGTGIIFSVGLLRMIEKDEALRFIMSQRGCGGGDCLLGRLLWFRMGIGFTDPGTALQYGAAKYEKYCRFVDSNEQLGQIAALSDPVGMLLGRWRFIHRAKPCDHACVWLFENVVGLHVRAQNRQVNNIVVEMVKRIHLHRRAYDWIMRARRDPAVASRNLTVVRWVRNRYGNVSLPNVTAIVLEQLASGTAFNDAIPREFEGST